MAKEGFIPPKRGASLSLCQSKFKDGESKYVKFLGPIFLGKEIKGSKMEPAKIAHVCVIDTATGERKPASIVVPAVLLSKTLVNFPNGGYIGKSMELIQLEKPENKRYHDFEIYALDDIDPKNTVDPALFPAPDGAKTYLSATDLDKEESAPADK